MPKSVLSVALAISVLLAGIASHAAAKPVSTPDGRALFAGIFNPESYFPFDWRGRTKDGTIRQDELVLTVRTSARDDYVPDYALAVAYVCTAAGEGKYSCDHVARMLRFKGDDDAQTAASVALIGAMSEARTEKQRVAAYDKAGLEWLEASLWSCEGAIEAFDTLATKADWQPGHHYTRLKMENRQVVLHPAAMWVRMQGQDSIASYEGWRNNNGAAAGVNALVSVLEKCWKPAKTPPPWRS